MQQVGVPVRHPCSWERPYGRASLLRRVRRRDGLQVMPDGDDLLPLGVGERGQIWSWGAELVENQLGVPPVAQGTDGGERFPSGRLLFFLQQRDQFLHVIWLADLPEQLDRILPGFLR